MNSLKRLALGNEYNCFETEWFNGDRLIYSNDVFINLFNTQSS